MCADKFTHRGKEGTDQRASLVLFSFFGGDLGGEGEAQNLRSGFCGSRDGICELTGMDRLRNLAEEEERPV